MCIHTAGAWEDEKGTIFLESSRVDDNAFPFFPSEDGRVAPQNTKADFVSWKIDPSQPTNTSIPDPQVVLDVPSEFPRIDERFMTSAYKYIWLNVFVPENSHSDKNLFHITIPPAKRNSSTSAMIPWSRNRLPFRVMKEPRKATDMSWLW